MAQEKYSILTPNVEKLLKKWTRIKWRLGGLALQDVKEKKKTESGCLGGRKVVTEKGRSLFHSGEKVPRPSANRLYFQLPSGWGW